jgi:hypothetical protein
LFLIEDVEACFDLRSQKIDLSNGPFLKKKKKNLAFHEYVIQDAASVTHTKKIYKNHVDPFRS